MIAYRTLSVLILSILFAPTGAAAAGVTPIAAQQIADAIAASGVDVSAGQVALLSDVVARSRRPILKVGPMEPWGDHRVKFRLECADPRDCIPFFVAVRWNQDQPGFSTAQNPGGNSAHAVRSTSKAIPFAVHAGSFATLLLDGDHIHIQLPVICLESGRSGQTIHVSSKDRRQTYTAEIVNSGELRAKLQ